jgi:hypothetical protein
LQGKRRWIAPPPFFSLNAAGQSAVTGISFGSGFSACCGKSLLAMSV